MFSGLMVNAWLVGTLVAVAAGAVGLFVVLRGATFAAHGVPLSSFAGAAGANVLGVSTLAGLGVAAPVSALAISLLARRRRSDVATALVVAAMLSLGSLFLSWSAAYAPAVYALLFGQILGVSTGQVWATAGLAAASVAMVALWWRPLLLTSVAPELAEGRGVRAGRMEALFFLLVAAVTTFAVPVVGTLLMFTLMVGPPAAARAFAADPWRAALASVAVALVTVWVSVAASYLTNWPVGFFVGTIGAAWYAVGRAVTALRRR